MKNNFNKAFTLVELIVVITILAILSTIGFISMIEYSQSSRDAVRTTDLKSITKAFEFQKTKDITLPLPHNAINISSSGSVFQYQGVLSEKILAENNVHGGGKDPQNGEYFGYIVNKNFDKFQIITFLENQRNINKNNVFISDSFANNSDKFAKTSGDKLGFILDNDTKKIIVDETLSTEIDIESETGSFAFVTNSYIETGKDDFLKKEFEFLKNPIASCQTILYSGNSKGDGFYTINPTEVEGEEFRVYCDMTQQGGGWTLLLANREQISYANSSSDNLTIQTLPNYDNWSLTSQNSIDQLDDGNVNIVSEAIEKMKFQDLRFECLGDECKGTGEGIYTHGKYSTLGEKTGEFHLKGNLAWPFDIYKIYKNGGSYSQSNEIPYDRLSIGDQCATSESRPYEACVQIGLIGLDYYYFQNSIGLGVYGKEWYSEKLEINAPFGYMRHRTFENMKANIRIK